MRKMKLFLSLLWVLMTGIASVLHAQNNDHLSDQKAGAVLVFPFYTSNSATPSTHDTRITISNIGSGSAQATHVLLIWIDKLGCQGQNAWIYLTPNATYADVMSNLDADNQGYMLAIAVDATGCPVPKNVLIGSAFIKAPAGAFTIPAGNTTVPTGVISEGYSAQAFRGYQAATCNLTTQEAVLNFDGTTYDKVPNGFAVDFQNPNLVSGQFVTVASLNGAVEVPGSGLDSAASGLGQLFKCENGVRSARSFSSFLLGNCLAQGAITTSWPSNTPAGFYPLASAATPDIPLTLYFGVRAGVGLLITPKNSRGWSGIRPLHATSYTNASLRIPALLPAP